MHCPKREPAALPRSSFSAPTLGTSYRMVPAWVSHTQVPDNPPSVHYSVTPTPEESLVFDPWKRFHYDDLQATAERADGCPGVQTDATAPPARPGAVPDTFCLQQVMTLVVSLAVAACVLGVLLTTARLFMRQKDYDEDAGKSATPLANLATSTSRGPVDSDFNGRARAEPSSHDAQHRAHKGGRGDARRRVERKNLVPPNGRHSSSTRNRTNHMSASTPPAAEKPAMCVLPESCAQAVDTKEDLRAPVNETD